jgi:hypothetical protein
LYTKPAHSRRNFDLSTANEQGEKGNGNKISEPPQAVAISILHDKPGICVIGQALDAHLALEPSKRSSAVEGREIKERAVERHRAEHQ